MTWNPWDEPVDFILLAGKRSPGVAEIVGASSVRKWDERDGFGISGAWLVYKGRGLAHFSVRLHLTTPADWEAWEQWRPIVDRLPKRRMGGKGRDSGSIDIWHPYLERLGIAAVCVAEVIAPEQIEDGRWMIELRLIEFRQPTAALAKPEGAAATEHDPIDDVIEGMSKQVDSLASE